MSSQAIDQRRRHSQLVCIGGSAGALEPLCRLIARLPNTVGIPIAIVLHIPRHRASSLAEVIAHKVGRTVVEPDDKEPVADSMVYIAPPDYHLLIDTGPSLSLSVDEPVKLSQPSIDVLFESAANTLGPGVVGVVLSGANADGASGLAAIVAAGGRAFVQAPDTAEHRVMPAAAIAKTPTASALPVEEISVHLGRLWTGEVR